jgi:murein DD-endopeptidase MepM/ murein hydrolase activator NlpD
MKCEKKCLGKTMYRYKLIVLTFLLLIFWGIYANTTHTVKRGDTLFSIARANGMSVDELKRLNNLTSDSIRIGQQLTIYRVSSTTSQTSNPRYYLVRRGDTLSSIARAHSTTVNQIVAWNNLSNTNIFSNQRLIVGYETQTETSTSVTNNKYHIVLEGETLSSISRNYNMEVIDIIDFNRLTSFVLAPGQRIWLEDGHVPDIVDTDVATTDDIDEPVTTSSPDIEQFTHTVRRGENLFRISLLYGTTVDEIRTLNRLSSSSIREGQVLQIRGNRNLNQNTIPGNNDGRAILPVQNIRILSEYGMRGGRMHFGIDLAGAPGSPIFAVLPGRVIFSGVQRGYGNVVIIEHENGVLTIYGHNEANLVTVGDTVTQGQWIARLGNTGNATAYHVHFEYRVNGKARNPRELLPL